METDRPDENQGEEESNPAYIETQTPAVAACFPVLGRLVLFRLLYLCHVSFPALSGAFAPSLISNALANVGLPEWLVCYPGSGIGAIGSWSLSVTIIVTALDFIRGFSTRLADSIVTAANSSDADIKSAGDVSRLITIGRILFPIWMEMDRVVLAYGLVWSLVRSLPHDWQIVQQLSKLDWSWAYWAFLLSSVYAALWILHAVLAALWHDLSWRILVLVSTRAGLRGLIQLATLFGSSAAFSYIQMLSLYIPRRPRDGFGWPVNSTNICYHLGGLAGMGLEEYFEWNYAVISLLLNMWHLFNHHILPELSIKL
ncbi:hypothetical protein F5Y01DRAFT_322561 [Xylaria sp. FL0043]|nr:hypothetical protein F5Y01DRAFT_322561 [Xylaria sp. FL0043]